MHRPPSLTLVEQQLLALSLQYVYRHKIAENTPLEDTITFDKLAQVTKLNSKDLTRFLRVAISRHVFHEPKKGVIGHTTASKLLCKIPMLEACLLNIAEEFWPAFTRTVDATEKWPGSEEPNETVRKPLFLNEIFTLNNYFVWHHN